MSGKTLNVVRASKYRHVFGEAARKDKQYSFNNNQKPILAGDGNFIAASATLLAYASNGGGGPVIVHPISDVSRFHQDHPVLNVHKTKVVDLAFSPFNDGLLATAADDNTVKVTQVPETGLTSNIDVASASLDGNQKKVSIIGWHPTAANILTTISYDSTIRIFDVEAQSNPLTYDTGDNMATGFAWEDSGKLLAAATKGGDLRVFDPRQAAHVQTTQTFPGPKATRVSWGLVSGTPYLLTFGFKGSTRGFQVFDPRKLGEPISHDTFDSNAGVMVPYMDNDTGVLFLAGKGDGNIRYYELTNEAPFLHPLTEFRSGSDSQKGACFLPKRACDVTTCEIATVLRVTGDAIQPVSFQVPRKSDLFQEDIFPDAHAGVASVQSGEWLSGVDKPAVKRSLKPGSSGPAKAAATAFVAKKSPAQLEQELAAAHAKIAQLEAELAKLKH